MTDTKEASKIQAIEKSELLDNSETRTKGISYKTVGTVLQAVTVQLDEGEGIYSEAGKMSWMSQNIKMETRSRGINKVFSRIFTGESLFLNHFESTSGTGIVTFSSDQAGKIIPIDLDENSPAVIFQRRAFLCAEKDIDLSVALTKRISAGLFGGIGLILQKIAGKGKAHLIASGEVVMFELQEGEELLSDQGNLVAYEDSVDYDIQRVGGGLMNWVFGGEGLFNARLTGPGKVWLQTRKVSLSSYSGSGSNSQYSRSNSGGFAQNPIGCIVGLLFSVGIFAFFVLIAIVSSLNS
ncbi:MAG TPA: TIGR00266 family protein [Candidatus Dojkabacteria bacterium]|jgi:uncharacterized protein (TIGR00266 family)